MTASKNPEKPSQFMLFADCIPVRGVRQTALCDLTRREITVFPTEYYDILQEVLAHSLQYVLDQMANDEEREKTNEFIRFLTDNEFAMFVGNASLFPIIQHKWDSPGQIQNAIVDVDNVLHDFGAIFTQLDQLGCQHVQIRGFSNLLNLRECENILPRALHTSITSIELVIKDEGAGDERYVSFLEQQALVVAITVHSSVSEKHVPATYSQTLPPLAGAIKEVRFTTSVISSQSHCGIITLKHLNAPTVSTFLEAKEFNGCLNRKISVDSMGSIRNCPSMEQAYGHIGDSSLEQALSSAGFKDPWRLSKDLIDVCSRCEFRYVCSDCRAYTERPEDDRSKPLKCGYNPDTAQWEDWSKNPLNVRAIEYYKIQV